jgi:REP-associated tyrosine transposase
LTHLDYRAYLARLRAYQEQYGVSLYAYCLMPNHVHLLAQTSDAPLSKFMQGVQQSYTQRFNRVHGKVGHLFQGRYKAIVCDRDEYLTTLVRYIHLNPVRAGLVEDPARYPYSGHRTYLSGDGDGFLDPTPVLSVLGGRTAYRRFVQAGMQTGHEERYYPVDALPFLGTPGFVDRIAPAAVPIVRVLRKPLDLRIAELEYRLAMKPGTLRGPTRTRSVSQARAAVSFVLLRRMGYRLTDVAMALDRDAATICMIVSRLAGRLDAGDSAAVDDVARLCPKVEKSKA